VATFEENEKKREESRRRDRELFKEAMGGIGGWAIFGWIPSGILVFLLGLAFESSFDVLSVYLGGFVSLLLFAGVFWHLSLPSKRKFGRFGSGGEGNVS